VTAATRSPNRRGQGGRLREELLAAATRLLDAGGRDAELTLRGVAREAGVAAPSVYPHFTDLETLMLELIRVHLDTLGEALDAADRRVRSRPASERLRTMAHAYVRWGLEHPGPYTVLFEGRALRRLTREQELAMLAGTDLFAGLAALLAALPEPPDDPELAATAVWTSLHGLVALRLGKPAYPWPPVRRHVDAVLDAPWQLP
jgi:AcrR family transcriptional regulator